MDYSQRDRERKEQQERDEVTERDQKRRDAIDREAREKGFPLPDLTPHTIGVFGERTKVAEFILTLGIFSFGSGALLYIIHWIMPSVVGVNLAQGLLGGGLSCILLVSFFKVFFYILILGAVSILMADGSKPPDGFSMSNIPMQSYLAAIGMVAFAFVLRRVLSRPE